MSADGYTRVTLADLPALPRPGERVWSPVRHALGISSFGVNAYTAARAGGEVIDPHDEADSRHEELYVVLRGAARFTVAGDSFHAPAGALVWVSDPGLERSAVATEDDTTVLCLGGVAGDFDPRPWEAERVAELSGR
jgi:quercetin dioxygenase-like cupin family protein